MQRYSANAHLPKWRMAAFFMALDITKDGPRGCLQTDGLGAHAQAPVIRYRRPYNMTHCYATAMLMARMTPAFCAKQLGHSVEMFLTTYSKWIDGDQNDLEMALERAISSPGPPQMKAKST
ncbi:hypothetical protein J6350_10550 [Burkholderia pseudomallei]|uniref:hypothetical protein n=1 Tax=Burkholderia pseudomallei TaxID=28450 RepID=UPI001AAE2716|nr:hypothetical protein [Burkholderia pseudomallei]MBO3031638.1 hypothetical protein [Burkholderia pseudomallei]MBO7845570.1 hypothetical protein [Burkholderia pseudomallei]